MRTCGLIGCLLLAGSANAAGILVFRFDQGLQFAEAVAVFVNGKDKALSLGAQPKITAPISKLSDVRLAPVSNPGPAIRHQAEATFKHPSGSWKLLLFSSLDVKVAASALRRLVGAGAEIEV